MTGSVSMNQRAAVVEWFESDFKDSARATTKTRRLGDGKLDYSFSVVNNSGFDFDRFSFRIKVINKTDNREIGTAVINAGAWASGENKTFRSKLAIPADTRSLSFVMYSNSLEFEAGGDGLGSAVRDVGDALKGMGDALSGADGSGGVFGELFGTGGMPGTTTTRTTTTRTAGGTTTTTTTTRTTTSRQPGNAQRSGANRTHTETQNFKGRKTEKKLNKMRLGKSGWTTAAFVFGILFAIAALGSDNTTAEMIEFFVLGGGLLAAGGISKGMLSKRARRIRTYEASINKNGNTSIDDLCSKVGMPFDKVADELQKLLVDGFFGEGYVDLGNRMLVMTRNGKPIESVEASAAENKKAKRRAAREKGVLPESLDDLITMTDDSDLKVKLRTLRMISRKIDARIEEVPELGKQVKDFREKYYPEVVRLTDAYNEKIADMGDLGYEKSKGDVYTDASGAPVINSAVNHLEEQAAGIKEQLISLIDSVTEASENLLEKLHEDDIMDITTDIKLLQTTLASKGLLDSDFDVKL